MKNKGQAKKDAFIYKFPDVSPSIIQRVNKLSGKTTFASWLLMFLGLLISPFTGFASIFLWIVPVYAAVFLMFLFFLFAPGCLAWILLPLVALFVVCVIAMLFPFIVGLPVGYIESALAKKGRCRSPAAGAVMGSLAGFLSIGLVGAFMIIVSKVPSDLWMEPLIIFSVFGLLAAWGGGLGGYWGIKQSAYCEKSRNWYSKWSIEKRFGLNAIEPLAAALNQMDPDDPDRKISFQADKSIFASPPGEEMSALVIQTRRCPKCTDTDIEWHAFLRLKTGEKKQGYMEFIANAFVFPIKVMASEKGFITQMTNRHKIFHFLPNIIHKFTPASENVVEWFDIMLPAKLSVQLEELISFTNPAVRTMPPPIPQIPPIPN